MKQGLATGFLARLEQATHRVRLLSISCRALLGRRRGTNRHQVSLLAGISTSCKAPRATLVVNDGQGAATGATVRPIKLLVATTSTFRQVLGLLSAL